MNEWLIQCGLWLARLGGWLPAAPVPLPPDAALLHEVQSKLQMRGVELAAARDQVQVLERRLAQSILPSIGGNVLTRATELIRTQAERDVSGEAKRHTVYAQLIKDFPDVLRRELGLAIEVALVKEK